MRDVEAGLLGNNVVASPGEICEGEGAVGGGELGLLPVVEKNERVGNGLVICGVYDDAVEFEEVVVGLRLLLGVG